MEDEINLFYSCDNGFASKPIIVSKFWLIPLLTAIFCSFYIGNSTKLNPTQELASSWDGAGETWSCSNCGNTNYRWEMSCNRCGNSQ